VGKVFWLFELFYQQLIHIIDNLLKGGIFLAKQEGADCVVMRREGGHLLRME
jgi:hypothetical protein